MGLEPTLSGEPGDRAQPRERCSVARVLSPLSLSNRFAQDAKLVAGYLLLVVRGYYLVKRRREISVRIFEFCRKHVHVTVGRMTPTSGPFARPEPVGYLINGHRPIMQGIE